MIDYAALEAVFAVVEEGSFDKAAARLRVSPSAVSHRVKSIEERVGTPLIVRGSPCVPTEAGQRICRHVERVHLLEAKLRADCPNLWGSERRLGSAKARVVINADSLSTWCMSAFSNFTDRTGCLLDLAIEDQDFALDWLTNGKTDAAVTATAKPATGCNVYALGSLRYHATASPDFVERYFPDGVSERAFHVAPSLTFNRKDSLQQKWSEMIFGKWIECPTHWIPSSNGFVDAALRGMGWGMNPEHLVAEHLNSGSLVELIPNRSIDTPLYWQINRISEELLSELTVDIQSAARDMLRKQQSE